MDVRLLYDGTNEFFTLPRDYPKRLKKLGIQAKAFAPVMPFVSTHYNYRDHRKILVIDGKVAFTGGVNLADEYINRVRRFGHWKDCGVLLWGEAVRSFTLMFLQMWDLDEKAGGGSRRPGGAPPRRSGRASCCPMPTAPWTGSGWANGCIWTSCPGPGAMCTS